MLGTIAPTDYGWYTFLHRQQILEEVNFWRPSAFRAYRAPEFSPFLFKLKSPHNAICGFGYYAGYAAVPYWMAWESFGVGNGCADEKTMHDRIIAIRNRMAYRSDGPDENIGCIQIVSPTFFDASDWIAQPTNWPPKNLTPMRYELEEGEGKRVWEACRKISAGRGVVIGSTQPVELREPGYGAATLVRPRLGQGTFRIAVTEAYSRACAITGEHSLPVLDAAHIRPYVLSGPHDVRNGLLLRTDLHRLFDKGYITISPELRIEVSPRLKTDYSNGRSYYPLHGKEMSKPVCQAHIPATEFLRWHNENKYRP